MLSFSLQAFSEGWDKAIHTKATFVGEKEGQPPVWGAEEVPSLLFCSDDGSEGGRVKLSRCLGDSQISPLLCLANLLPVFLTLPCFGPRRPQNFRPLRAAAAMTLECTPSSILTRKT